MKEKNKKKGWFSKVFDKLDKKLEEKAAEQSCCKPKTDSKGSSCC